MKRPKRDTSRSLLREFVGVDQPGISKKKRDGRIQHADWMARALASEGMKVVRIAGRKS